MLCFAETANVADVQSKTNAKRQHQKAPSVLGETFRMQTFPYTVMEEKKIYSVFRGNEMGSRI